MDLMDWKNLERTTRKELKAYEDNIEFAYHILKLAEKQIDKLGGLTAEEEEDTVNETTV